VICNVATPTGEIKQC